MEVGVVALIKDNVQQFLLKFEGSRVDLYLLVAHLYLFKKATQQGIAFLGTEEVWG